ncbi:MAG: rod shape-determining protein MreD [Actinomycetota bacterium]|nr:rod shape-determining protein MreD [Actinomycetota bacterium]
MSTTVKEAKVPGFFSEAGIGRIFAVGLVVFVALALQTTVLSRLTLLGVIPQLVLVVVVSLAFLDGERVGIVSGFFGGLLLDLQLPPDSIVGLTALVYTMIGFGVGYFRQYSVGESVWTPVLAVAISSAVAEAGYALLAIMLGRAWVSVVFTAQVIGLVVLYDALLTPFVFPLVRRVADRFRPERVFQW